MKIINRILTLIGGVLLVSCAQIVPLSGGERDTTPPEEVKSYPQNNSINIKAQKIEIEFSEFIQLQNIQQEFIASPPFKNKPTITARGKKVIIQLNDSLNKNTTYCLNFGYAIVDITEQNPKTDYKYVFSTGNYIDSLKFKGQVLSAFELEPQEQVLVMLYKTFDDSLPLKQKPDFVGRTNSEGRFEITNLKEGEYKCFALKDQNSNYIYDLPNEEIAFLKDPIYISSKTLLDTTLYLFKEDNELQFVKSFNAKKPFQIAIKLYKPADSISVNSLNNIPSSLIKIHHEKLADYCMVWYDNPNQKDSLSFEVLANGKIVDTISFPVPKDLKDKITIKSNVSTPHCPEVKISVKFDYPITSIDTSLITLLEDSVPVAIDYFFNEDSTQLTLKNKWKEHTFYQLNFLPKAVTFKNRLFNDTAKVEFKTNSKSYYSSLFLKLNSNKSKDVLIYFGKQNETIAPVYIYKSVKNIEFVNNEPGNYTLKLAIDENGNEKWDTGNYLQKKSPEKIIKYNKPIALKQGWDSEIIWELNY